MDCVSGTISWPPLAAAVSSLIGLRTPPAPRGRLPAGPARMRALGLRIRSEDDSTASGARSGGCILLGLPATCARSRGSSSLCAAGLGPGCTEGEARTLGDKPCPRDLHRSHSCNSEKMGQFRAGISDIQSYAYRDAAACDLADGVDVENVPCRSVQALWRLRDLHKCIVQAMLRGSCRDGDGGLHRLLPAGRGGPLGVCALAYLSV